MASSRDTRFFPDRSADSRVDPPSVPPARSKADTPVEGSSKRNPVPQAPGSKVYQPHYEARQTKQITEPSAFGAIQDLKATLKLRHELEDQRQRDNEARFTELERDQGRVSTNDLGHEKALAEAFLRLKRLESLPADTKKAINEANDSQLDKLKSSKLTEYLRLFGVVLGTAIASYFASYRGSSEGAPKTTTVNVSNNGPSAGAISDAGLD